MKQSVLQTLLEPATATTVPGKRPQKARPTCTNNRRDNRRALLAQDKCGRMPVLVGALVFCVTVYLYFTTTTWTDTTQMIVTIPADDVDLPGPKVPKGFLVWGPGCQIMDLDPLAKDVMRLFTKERFEACSPKHPLTTIEQNFDNDTVLVRFHRELVESYMPHYMRYFRCCYQSIERAGAKDKADKHFWVGECIEFNQSFLVPPSVRTGILIRCKAGVSKASKTKKAIYTNTHALVRPLPEVQERMEKFKGRTEKRPLSVLMIGIDSISRLNLIRAMPHTAQHLYDTGWFELKGYNKIDDNTYPNLMAILTGYNNSLAYTICNPKEVGKLDDCPFMWKYFADNGYATAYAEDEASINTFNYHKYGFVAQPTDHYFRPVALAAEKNLSKKMKNSLTFCLGYQHYADHIYQYALDFASQYRNDPYFGLFWTNTFSHNDISDPSSMDQRMKYYIGQLDERGILNSSMVVFFSDHGLRFGPVRMLLTGWLEERLPFNFIWLPEWFREEHPEIVQALKINRNRLTNPYDLHATLKHVLELSGRIENLPGPLSCPNCQSIFTEVPWNRSCEETAIESHWCTCSNFQPIDKRSVMVRRAVAFVLDYVNRDLQEHRNSTTSGNVCAKLTLGSITLAKMAHEPKGKLPYNDYLLIFEGKPGGGKFESTVRHYQHRDAFEITGSISRLNEYASQSECMHIDYLRKYCYCQRS
ncbi:AGAP006068-PC-like protein [Anopheles sinensis]|uniref:AGAP006068-PC-like protein n=1 Tax=Anopheles sinensis TaxID=74873 RepID=A0A084WRY1_ANOSI|nr:AGAP006068-PC-like protein [Anopheles sinensis]